MPVSSSSTSASGRAWPSYRSLKARRKSSSVVSSIRRAVRCSHSIARATSAATPTASTGAPGFTMST